MKGQGKVKGILVEGNDGHEYLLGFGSDHSPIFSRREADGTFEPTDPGPPCPPPEAKRRPLIRR